ncbi:MAG: hypothetical protein ABSG43_14555 [Solirubrobacteraceae bacterium]
MRLIVRGAAAFVVFAGGLIMLSSLVLFGGGVQSAPCGAPALATGSVNSPLLTSDQRLFGSELVARTGLDPDVVAAWLLAEENGSAAADRAWANNNDWLNIGYTGPITYGAGDNIWASPVSAADSTYEWMGGSDTAVAGYPGAGSGIQAILTTVGQPPAAEIQAIQTSGWATSGYPDLPADYTTVTGRSATTVSVSEPVSQCPVSAGVPVSDSGYVNPFERATGLSWERTDQGVDAGMTVGSPIVALGDSKVLMIIPFFEGQPAIVMQLMDGSLSGDLWYISEQITPTVAVGQTVQAGRPVATYAPCCTRIEIGWWQPGPGGYPLGHDYDGNAYDEGIATVPGADFRYLLNQLGANSGTGAGLSSGMTVGTTDYPVPT